MGIIIPALIIIFSSILIWKSSNIFEISSLYLGRNLTDGVRGATINAISSSLPELLATLFFLILLKDSEGFIGGLGTTAGSAVFNSLLIPMLCILFVIIYNNTKAIEYSSKIIYRDGIALLIAEIILIITLSNNNLFWWHGAILMITYFGYLTFIFITMKKNKEGNTYKLEIDFETKRKMTLSDKTKFILLLDFHKILLNDKIINNRKAIILLFTSLFVMAISTFILVFACELLSSDTYTLIGSVEFKGLGLSISVISILIASAATSVPDTIISIKDAKRGNADDAISNAYGSNIFDICFALGLPLFLYCLYYGPIPLNGFNLSSAIDIRFSLLLITFLSLIVMVWGKKAGYLKALMLLLLYLGFIWFVIFRI